MLIALYEIKGNRIVLKFYLVRVLQIAKPLKPHANRVSAERERESFAREKCLFHINRICRSRYNVFSVMVVHIKSKCFRKEKNTNTH